MASSSATASVDQKNIAFWNELCGTGLAKTLGITDDSPTSLKKFDDWYFNFYPHLYDHIHFGEVGSKMVLEIGLGYGTVAGKLMESGADYHGLDIADGPVSMARHRAELQSKQADVRQGSALAIPYDDNTFDYLVTIGCLHHTGDLARAMTEVSRVVKQGGTAMIMVYNALSYRHWKTAPRATLQRRLHPQFLWNNADARLRKNYDMNQEGSAAPETTFISPAEATQFLGRHFRSVNVRPRNIGDDFPPARILSRSTLNALFEPWLGLDLYIECIK
jgi:ubiquinone/menaquinone biosynthesis C-methylase UbiE